MEISTLAQLGFKHTTNATAETVYLKTGYDMTKPISFYGLVNERCNVKCLHCEYWRLKHYEEELKELEINNRPILGRIFVRIQGVVTGT